MAESGLLNAVIEMIKFSTASAPLTTNFLKARAAAWLVVYDANPLNSSVPLQNDLLSSTDIRFPVFLLGLKIIKKNS